MESTHVTLGSSLPVPNLQELAREHLITVPPRYVRPDQDPPVAFASESFPMVPTVDMERLLHEESMPLELEKLHSACKDWGFFQLVNHGVSTSLIEKMKSETQELFNLSLEEKKRYWQESGDLEGFGQAFVSSENQKLDWADMFYLATLPIQQRKHSLFEKLPFSFRETVEAYALELQKLAMTLLNFMSSALKMDAEELRELFEDGFQGMRTNYYPPCPQPQLVVGLTPHSDAVGLTILLQISEVPGLEIRKDEMWVPVKPLPNAFVVNVADALEMITNGVYRSVLHRATVNSVQERISVATFYSPKLTAEIGPSHSLTNPQNPPLYRRVTVEKYLKDLLARELNGKSLIETMKIK
ncbi:hypothetical protein MRB53_035956 [Persea americana]|uniref:Uncharacterized protein n=1 Tax=Persea americana TaxID=3435 RepID=A0ACC2K628_PERAE|nr:hypothetical protein MRB53_035956 [Persea americana]|eukprot:TRINITY_DN39578_c1_g1_i2.p1 TRINITY_DN39578_c1_g1~~TRINITY_DN39578_c1_g1_i2.p1  ORF type:complete len:356 (+),score=75.09 TRINITY_DN39578_c1_g1_i2:103-1170(+)